MWFALSLLLLLAAPARAQDIPPYDRSEYKHWSDLDGDCQDTRIEVLIRDADFVVLDGTSCRIIEGRWTEPYAGRTYRNKTLVHIEHIVPIHEAHVSGGWKWSSEEKELFANDPMNLIAVSGEINMSRGHKRPDEWRPPRPDHWCSWSTAYLSTKSKYGLSMTDPEELALTIMQETCPR